LQRYTFLLTEKELLPLASEVEFGLGLRSVRFGSVFTKTVTEPKLSVSVSVLTEKNQFGFDQNRYRSVITKNRTDLPTHSSGIHHAEG
jgi:hypothetical protein